MVQILFLEDSQGQLLYHILVLTHKPLGQDCAFADDSHYLLVDLGASFLAVDILTFGLDGGVVREGIAHAKTNHHGLGEVAHLLEIVSGST